MVSKVAPMSGVLNCASQSCNAVIQKILLYTNRFEYYTVLYSFLARDIGFPGLAVYFRNGSKHGVITIWTE